MLVGIALAIARRLNIGRASRERTELRKLVEDLAESVNELKMTRSTAVHGLAESISDMRQTLHEVHDSVNQTRRELGGTRDDVREHMASDDRRFELIDECAQAHHRENSARLTRIEKKLMGGES